jgi:iron-sulfur cluster repair protein YtfE (RIC family)
MPASAVPVSSADTTLFNFLDRCHQDIQEKLVQMMALAVAVEADGLSPALQAQARELTDWFNAEPRQHHLDEEKHIFPALLASSDENVLQTTHRLIQDHGWLEADWFEIEPSLEAAADGNAWFDPGELRQAVEVFQQLYSDHIVLEESLAYPQARERLDPALLASMGVEMARRRAIRDAKPKKAPRT